MGLGEKNSDNILNACHFWKSKTNTLTVIHCNSWEGFIEGCHLMVLAGVCTKIYELLFKGLGTMLCIERTSMPP